LCVVGVSLSAGTGNIHFGSLGETGFEPFVGFGHLLCQARASGGGRLLRLLVSLFLGLVGLRLVRHRRASGGLQNQRRGAGSFDGLRRLLHRFFDWLFDRFGNGFHLLGFVHFPFWLRLSDLGLGPCLDGRLWNQGLPFLLVIRRGDLRITAAAGQGIID